MKSRTWLAAAVIFLPLFFLAGGIGITVWRRADASIRSNPTPTAGCAKGKQWLAEGTPGTPVMAEPIAKDAPLERQEIRRRIVASLDRLYFVTRRSRECKELWPEAATEEEGRALQREEVGLRGGSGLIHRRLAELAEMDPANIVEMVRHARELSQRLQLMGLIAPDVEDEIASEDGPSGPLLSGLLMLAQGDPEEKMHFASFASRLTHGNRELGRVLLAFMADQDRDVRSNGAIALSELSRGGSLREFLRENTAALKQAAVRGDGPVG